MYTEPRKMVLKNLFTGQQWRRTKLVEVMEFQLSYFKS